MAAGKRYMNAEQVRDYLSDLGIDLGTAQIRKLAHNGVLPAVKPGKRVYFLREFVELYAEKKVGNEV